MQPLRCILLMAFCALLPNAGICQVAVYEPYGQAVSPVAHWRTALQSAMRLNSAAPGTGTRPMLPGLRPADTELLTDVLLRKQPRKLHGDPELARAKIRQIALDSQKPGNKAIYRLYGEMAEALFLETHPDWHYTRKPNATQIDVWKQINRRGHKVGGQVKFHRNGNPSRYFRDMRHDWAAKHFIVPDDHVVPLKEYIALRQQRAVARGDLKGFERLAQCKARVMPLGKTSDEVVQRTRNGANAPIAEANAIYMSLGAGVALSLGQIGWAYSRGSVSYDAATYAFTKGTVLLGASIVADQALKRIAGGALRGGLRGQALVGLAMLVVDTSWSIAERGGRAAFQDPFFYRQLGGSALAVTAGTAVGFAVAAITSESGPVALLAGTVTGAVVGTAAYFAGDYATNEFLREFFPSLYNSERKRVLAMEIYRALDSLRQLQEMPSAEVF